MLQSIGIRRREPGGLASPPTIGAAGRVLGLDAPSRGGLGRCVDGCACAETRRLAGTAAVACHNDTNSSYRMKKH